MEDRACALCGEPVLTSDQEGEYRYEATDPNDLRVWHEDCADPDAIENDEIFLVDV